MPCASKSKYRMEGNGDFFSDPDFCLNLDFFSMVQPNGIKCIFLFIGVLQQYRGGVGGRVAKNMA